MNGLRSMKFLLVEDDPALAYAVERTLAESYYVSDLATDGAIGYEMATAFAYDCILLDWALPKLNGVALCNQLRSEGNYTPIILMTSRDAHADRVAGLDAGADDYLVKPFSFEELLARIRALLRRSEGMASPVLQWNDLRLDPSSSRVTYRGLRVALTPKEHGLLELFLRHPNRIFSLDNLLDKVWPFDESPGVGAVRTHMRGLRQKLRDVGLLEIVETVYGLGYRLKPAEATSGVATDINEVKVEDTDSLKQRTLSGSSQLDMVALWESLKVSYTQRIRELANLIFNAQPGLFEAAAREQVLREAHTLAGSLGSFGFLAVTQHCRDVEHILSANAYLSVQQLDRLKSLVVSIQEALAAGVPEAVVPKTAVFETVVSERLRLSLPTASENRIEPPLPVASYGRSIQLLVVGGVDLLSAQTMKTALGAISSNHHIAISLVENVAQARRAIFEAVAQPDVVLLDLSGFETLLGEDSDEIGLMREIARSPHPVPVLLLAQGASFADRIRFSRLGVEGVFQQPWRPAEILETAEWVVQKQEPPIAKVLVVDDDLALLKLIKNLLQPWGFRLALLQDPLCFWQTIEQFSPDLVLLDVEMPQVSGLELAQVLRSAPQWHQVPIIFMSVHTDADTIQQVFSVGADDYVRKPIVAPELLARVLGWSARLRSRVGSG
ncbi:MAG: transcriptional regulator [Leptolyngbya foveolarum]|uniref:Transcriptional regulator n=1 Tax=Leptolyngbya foveolarum TaxID=47253 RepID=A0A2W4TH24_9CYAN|nr:MAG: transcriptional regulator [Leptolyngbya foveolarum]